MCISEMNSHVIDSIFHDSPKSTDIAFHVPKVLGRVLFEVPFLRIYRIPE